MLRVTEKKQSFSPDKQQMISVLKKILENVEEAETELHSWQDKEMEEVAKSIQSMTIDILENSQQSFDIQPLENIASQLLLIESDRFFTIMIESKLSRKLSGKNQYKISNEQRDRMLHERLHRKGKRID